MLFTNDHIRKAQNLNNQIAEIENLAKESGVEMTPEIKEKLQKASQLMQEITDDMRSDFAEAMQWNDLKSK